MPLLSYDATLFTDTGRWDYDESKSASSRSNFEDAGDKLKLLARGYSKYNTYNKNSEFGVLTAFDM